MSEAGLALVAFRPVRRNTLRGFAKVQLRNGLIIDDVYIGEKDGRSWAWLPSKMMAGRDGKPMLDKEGKTRYQPIVAWATDALQDEFSRRMSALVREKHPEAFD